MASLPKYHSGLELLHQANYLQEMRATTPGISTGLQERNTQLLYRLNLKRIGLTNMKEFTITIT